MDENLVEMIKREMYLRDTEDLIDIWKPHDLNKWTEETFEAVRQILLMRLDQLPYQDNQDEANGHLDRIQSYLDSGQLDQALIEADLAVQAAPHFGETHLARGVLLEEMGRSREAILAYEEALRLDETLWEARKYSRYLRVEQQKEWRATQTQSRFDYGGIFKTAWELLWKEKFIWIAAAIMLIIDQLRTIPFPSQSQTMPGILLSCLDLPVDLFLSLVSLALIAFMTLLFYQLNTQTQYPVRELWTSARKSVLRLIRLYLIGYTVVIIPILALSGIGFIFNSTHPTITYVSIISIISLLIVGEIVGWMLKIELVVHHGPFLGNLKHGLKRVFNNFGVVLVLSLLLAIPSTVQIILFTVLPIAVSQVSLALDINTLKTVIGILNEFPVRIPAIFSSTLIMVFVNSVMVTFYCKISEPDLFEKQPVFPDPALSEVGEQKPTLE